MSCDEPLLQTPLSPLIRRREELASLCQCLRVSHPCKPAAEMCDSRGTSTSEDELQKKTAGGSRARERDSAIKHHDKMNNRCPLQGSPPSISGKEILAEDSSSPLYQITREGNASLEENKNVLRTVNKQHRCRGAISVKSVYEKPVDSPGLSLNCEEDPEIMLKDKETSNDGGFLGPEGKKCQSMVSNQSNSGLLPRQKGTKKNMPIRLRRLKLNKKLLEWKEEDDIGLRKAMDRSAKPSGISNAISRAKTDPQKNELGTHCRKLSLPSLADFSKGSDRNSTSCLRKISDSQHRYHGTASRLPLGSHRGATVSPNINRDKSRISSGKDERHTSAIPSDPALKLRVQDFLSKEQPISAPATLRTVETKSAQVRRCGLSQISLRGSRRPAVAPAGVAPRVRVAVNTNTCPSLKEFQDRSWYYQDKAGKCRYLRVPESPTPPISWIFEDDGAKDDARPQI